jgi:ABC-2 type transport system ATP-binding protein
MTNKIIEVTGLTRHFRVLKRHEGLGGAFRDLFSRDYLTVKAVDGITFSVDSGEIVGFIGPNGAGKSTTIKMLTGVLKPTAGTVTADSFSPFKDRRRYVANIGVVLGQRSQLWWNLPVIESFKVLKDIYCIPEETYRANLKRFNDLIDLKQYYHTPVRKLSLGQKSICDIAAAFLHSPRIIFLDEPTIGLDVSIKKSVRAIIRSLNKELGTTVIVTTHDIGDIENLCPRIILIDKGRLVYDGPTARFNKAFGSFRTLHLDIRDLPDRDRETLEETLKERFPCREHITVRPSDDGWVTLTLNQDEVNLIDVLNHCLSAYQVKDVKIEELSLEDVIIKAYEGALT